MPTGMSGGGVVVRLRSADENSIVARTSYWGSASSKLQVFKLQPPAPPSTAMHPAAFSPIGRFHEANSDSPQGRTSLIR